MPAKILIVEDNADTCEYLSLLLRGQGYTTYIANDGNEGIKQAKANHPDLIISDIAMPNLDGVEMVKALRQLPEYKKTPILLMSAHGSRKMAEALVAGANQALYKPIDLELFLPAIEKLLS